MHEFEFRNVKGHVEVFLNDVFQFSADDEKEAREELEFMGKGEEV